MSRPEDVRGYEELAESGALFNEGDLVVYDPAPGLIPARVGKIKWRRWECGNRCWGYSVALEGGTGSMTVEHYLRTREGADA
jgi:hypothetical protein